MAQQESNFHSQKLINLIDTTWRQFSDIFVPLTNEQQDDIKRCSQVVAMDPSTIHRNYPKLWAHNILSEILDHSEELFFLCALSTSPYQISKLKSEEYLRYLVYWRRDKTCPKGLKDAITHYHSLFPNKKATDGLAYRTVLQEIDLADFMKSYSGTHRSFMIRVPDDINEQPAIEISREMCQALIKFVMEKTQERMIPVEATQEEG